MQLHATNGERAAADRITQLVAEVGELRAAQALHISRQTLARILAGLEIRRGTAALIRERLRELGQVSP